MEKITKKSYAKINLALDVIKKRVDGYHELSMVMCSVDLYDILTVSQTSKRGIKISSNKASLPTDERNIAYRAAELFLKNTGIICGLDIYIEKNIPIGAGLAGGSSNAACILIALNEMFDINKSASELMSLGGSIGADVPFCIMGGCAHASGIGTKLTPIKSNIAPIILLAKPEFSVSTKWVYENLDISGIKNHPNIAAVIKGITSNDMEEIAGNTANVLEAVTISHYPVLNNYKKIMLENGAIFSLMSGSGPTIFGIFKDKDLAWAAQKKLSSSADFVWVGEIAPGIL